MICPYCQTKNPCEARYCMNCGKSVEHTCSRCGKNNPPQAKFCIKCGNSLVELDVSSQDPIQKHLPKDYADKLEVARRSQTMMGERRVVTILFCDVKGSTSMAEKLDPEEWAEIINQAFEYLIAPIYKYEGTLARLMGDSVLAFFGAPIAHEDDAQRAIFAGLDIIEGIKPFRKKIERRYQLDFNVRIGINTGLVVVGGVGSDLFMEYTAMGDAINIAARMEQTARPGTIQIAENTYKKISHLFDVEIVEGIDIRGKSDSVLVYRVLGVKEGPVYRRGIQGLEAPLIGRKKEVDQLVEILDNVKKGRGQIVCMISEAGLGKTRLLREARQIWDVIDLGVGPFGKIQSRWNQAGGISYQSARPYGLIQQLILNFIGASASDSAEDVREALMETLKLSGFDPSPEIFALFETVLGIKQQKNGDELEGEELKKAIYKELLSSLDFLVQKGPTVIAVDDLHWVDETSIEFFIHLFQLTDRLPILFICAFRTDRFSPAWKVRQVAESDYAHRYAEITLSPLSNSDATTMINCLFVEDGLPSYVRNLILEKSDGNPFFIEEVIRTLMDNHVVTQDSNQGKLRTISQIDQIMIPDNLQALLVARIDRLDDLTKHILQIASVIGRTFYYRVLEMISDAEEELENQLNNLQRLGLIVEVAREPYLEYIFRQTLTQETAYNTILLKHRRELHRQVGQALEEIFKDRENEFASIIGHHFYQAQDPWALKYYRMEGDAALKLYANIEAINYYSKAIDAASWSDEPDLDQLVPLYTGRGRAYELDSQFSKAIGNYKELERLARDNQAVLIELSALIAQAQIHSVPSNEFNVKTGLELINKAQEIAEEMDDQTTLAKIYWITTNLYRFSNSLGEAQKVGEKSILLSRELGLEEQLAYSLADTSHTYTMNGQVIRGRELSMEAVELWRKLNNQPMLADSLAGLATIHVFSGDFDFAYRYSNEAYEISQRIENVWGQSYSRYSIGFVDMERGDIDLAIQRFNQSMKDARESNFFAGEILTKSFLSILYSDLGHFQLALEMVDSVFEDDLRDTALTKTFFLGAELLSRVRSGKLDEAEKLIARDQFAINRLNFYARQYAQLALCYLPFAKKEYKTTIRETKKFLRTLQSNGIKYLSLELLLLITKSQIALEMWQEAETTLESALPLVEQLNSRRSGWQVNYLLGRCAHQNGDQEKAAAYFGKSKEIIDFILEHISDEELRGYFLSRESVKFVLEAVVEQT